MAYISHPSRKNHDLKNPDSSLIDIGDVAWHLSNLQRYNGGCVRSYTVAEHAIRVALNVMHSTQSGERYAYAALHHDSHEAYVGDASAPLLAAVPELDALVQLWGAACDVAFGVRPDERACADICAVDVRIRDAERLHVLQSPATHECEWSEPWFHAESDLRALGCLARPSFWFSSATRDQLATLFVVCHRTFEGLR